jgi:hypothetical protein
MDNATSTGVTTAGPSPIVESHMSANTSVLPIPPVHVEMVPNQETVINLANQDLINLVAKYNASVTPEQLYQIQCMEKISA